MPRLLTLALLAFAFIIGTLAFFTPSTYSSTPLTPGAFITTWDTTNPGTSGNDQITIPGTGAGYSYSIYWESLSDPGINGTTSTSTASSYTLTFPTPGQYRVDIIGAFPRIYFNNGGDRQKILTVEQWGDNAWTSMFSSFQGASNLRIPATDAPDLSGVGTMQDMFANAISFNDPVDHWDVSNVGNLLRVFSGATDFNQPLDAWDVSNVNDMRSAFAGATSFNQPLNSWDVSNVTTFGNLFQNASSFNQPLDNWDVSGVSGIGSMFQGATSFNQPLDAWDVSNVVNSNRMFFGAIAFNQPLSSWNTASNTNMIRMFENSAFNHSLATWDITSVTTMDLMFRGTHLSPSNLDATLVSWAGQAVQNNVPLHVGAKTYTSAGATALATLRDTYNWTITEQYLLTYDAGDNATLEGQSIQQLNSGDTGTAVTVTPRSGYRFIAWSDGITTSTRTDTNITDNVTLTAQIESIPSPRRGTSAARQAQNLESIGKIEEAAALCRQFPNACPTTTASTTGSSTQVLISLVKPEYRAIMAALLQVFGW